MEYNFNDLNEAQLEAVYSTEGYIRVIAGAGSGKTRALTARFVYLVNELGIDPRNILCVTFTNKAANEMRSRIKKILNEKADSALITTYHGFCVRVLREDIHKLFYPENFMILDIPDQKKILEEIYGEYDIKMDYDTFEHILKYILEEKAHLVYIPKLTDPGYIIKPDEGSSLNEKIYLKYLAKQKKIFGLDFHDLLYFVLHLFEHNTDSLEKWRSRLHYIQVDEFQDSSKKELDLINFLCTGNDNLFVVGDPDQNIYEWRLSEIRFLVHFDKNYPDVKTIFLNQNYRSTPQILSVSNSLIEKNKNRVPKSLFTNNSDGLVPVHYHCKSEENEQQIITDKIRSLVAGGYKYSDIAMLYRSSHVSRFIEQALNKENIPYIIQGGVRFYDRMEIKDSIAFLKVLHNGDDDSLLRIINVPKRQMGRLKINYLKDCQAKIAIDGDHKSLFDILAEIIDSDFLKSTGAAAFVNVINEMRENISEMKISELFNSLLEKVGYKEYIRMNGDMERLDNISELLSTVTQYEQSYGEFVSIESYLQQLAVNSDYDTDDHKNCVKCMTIHSAKGLEFPVVIIAGMSDGIFPSRRTLEERKQTGLEEERRLCYVALTRAMRELYLTESEGSVYGELRKMPSRFLFDIEQSLYTTIGTIPEEIIKNLRAEANKLSAGDYREPIKAFTIGENIFHKVFGKGEITGIDNVHDAYMIKFENVKNPKPIKRDFAGLSPYDENINLVGREKLLQQKIDENNKLSEIAKQNDKIFETTFTPKPENSDKTETVDNHEIHEVEVIEPVQIDIFGKEPEAIAISDGFISENANISDIDIAIDEKQIEIEKNNTLEKADYPSNFKRKIDKLFTEIKNTNEKTIPNENKTGETKQMPADIYTGNEEKSDYIVSLNDTAPELLHENNGRVNLWNDPSVPKSGWYCVDVIDLGIPSGECSMCGNNPIRYVHIMKHNDYPTLGVGCVCAGNMEGDAGKASERESALKNKASRLSTFIKKELSKTAKGNLFIEYKERKITFLKDKFRPDFWKYVLEGIFSQSFETITEAKISAFNLVDKK